MANWSVVIAREEVHKIGNDWCEDMGEGGGAGIG